MLTGCAGSTQYAPSDNPRGSSKAQKAAQHSLFADQNASAQQQQPQQASSKGPVSIAANAPVRTHISLNSLLQPDFVSQPSSSIQQRGGHKSRYIASAPELWQSAQDDGASFSEVVMTQGSWVTADHQAQPWHPLQLHTSLHELRQQQQHSYDPVVGLDIDLEEPAAGRDMQPMSVALQNAVVPAQQTGKRHAAPYGKAAQEQRKHDRAAGKRSEGILKQQAKRRKQYQGQEQEQGQEQVASHSKRAFFSHVAM